jgi:aspartyl-tRNA(Asn)/glutamyl-tRNA(Gln) amidotransferase subunit C
VIDDATVRHVARLARLHLEPGEEHRMGLELSGIIDHVGVIQSLDLDDVPPTSHPLPLVNVTRPDAVAPTLSRDEVLAAAPDTEDGRFRVPRILDAE